MSVKTMPKKIMMVVQTKRTFPNEPEDAKKEDENVSKIEQKTLKEEFCASSDKKKESKDVDTGLDEVDH